MKICSIYNVRKIKTTNTNWLYVNSERLTVRKKLTFLADEGCSTVIIIKTVWQQNAAVIHSHCCQCSSVEGRRHFVNLGLPTIPLSSLDPASKITGARFSHITQTAVTQKEITLELPARMAKTGSQLKLFLQHSLFPFISLDTHFLRIRTHFCAFQCLHHFFQCLTASVTKFTIANRTDVNCFYNSK